MLQRLIAPPDLTARHQTVASPLMGDGHCEVVRQSLTTGDVYEVLLQPNHDVIFDLTCPLSAS